MLKIKEAREILELCDSKQKIKEKFLDIYGCKKAIRLIRRDHEMVANPKGDYKSVCKNIFSCDKCGNLFVLTGDESKINACPNCGLKTKVKSYYYDVNYIDEVYDHFHYIFTKDNRTVEPCAVTYEIVKYENQLYHVMRRIHFSLENGKISAVRMVKCIIAGERKFDGSVLLYENCNGIIKTAYSGTVYNWFTHTKYREISCKNYLFDIVDGKKFHDYLKTLVSKYEAARRYFSGALVLARELIQKYPVDEKFSMEASGDTVEMHADYFVYREFCDGTENVRWIYSYKDKINTLVAFKKDEWVVETQNGPHGYYDRIFYDHIDVFKNSFVDKLGIFNFTDNNLSIFKEGKCVSVIIDYLSSIHSFPIIESIAKVGLKKLIPRIYTEEISVYKNQNQLWQKLGLSKHNYLLLFEAEIDSAACAFLQDVNVYDKYVDKEALLKFVNEDVKPNKTNLLSLMKNYKLSFKQIIDYMEKVQEEQGFTANPASETWYDYLNMFQEYYEFNAKKKEDLYPDSLKKAHDVVSMYLQRKNENAEQESFSAINKKWKKLVMKDKQFTVILPESTSDLNIESKVLGHCVHSYARRIKNGSSVILFLRKTSESGKPFFTMEYNCDDRLVQIRGKGNNEIMDISDTHKKLKYDIIQFLIKWGKKNNIKTGFETEVAKAA